MPETDDALSDNKVCPSRMQQDSGQQHIMAGNRVRCMRSDTPQSAVLIVQ